MSSAILFRMLHCISRSLPFYMHKGYCHDLGHLDPTCCQIHFVLSFKWIILKIPVAFQMLSGLIRSLLIHCCHVEADGPKYKAMEVYDSPKTQRSVTYGLLH